MSTDTISAIPLELEREAISADQRLESVYPLVLPLVRQIRQDRNKIIGSMPEDAVSDGGCGVVISPYYTSSFDHLHSGGFSIEITGNEKPENQGGLKARVLGSPDGSISDLVVRGDREKYRTPTESDKNRIASVLEILALNMPDAHVVNTSVIEKGKKAAGRLLSLISAKPDTRV